MKRVMGMVRFLSFKGLFVYLFLDFGTKHMVKAAGE